MKTINKIADEMPFVEVPKEYINDRFFVDVLYRQPERGIIFATRDGSLVFNVLRGAGW